MVEKKKTFQITVNIVMILLGIFCLIPFILLISSSITDETALINNGYRIFPLKFSLAAYKYLLADSTGIIRGYGITLFVTVIGTTLNVLLTSFLAYPLSRKDLPKRNIIAFFVFFTMLFNGGLVPSYIMWTTVFHIKNTIFALIVPNLLMNAFFVMMMRTYFITNIPDEIIEAARIDGAGEGKILFSVVFPMSLPMLATLGMMAGLIYWNDWTNGLYYLTKPKLFSIQNILNRMLQDAQFLTSNMSMTSNMAASAASIPTTGIKMAVAVLGALPIMLIYPFFQKYFIKGITVGAVKG
ncbi:carbohydrate ABC transporter permease [Clostridium sp. SYSU_GA19001]|uniref:carbohydrate ABC transporter permease n=1 Tax=Clostridium caldaquaticum TaxID=2940653 RepID=UPI0020773995|nr:carbohydrate ABC transporter permease [Clostridium caldaquaticum]MCM8711541.1 carbohydrate ABC transporter permease [Clostridium caldaquaticum]